MRQTDLKRLILFLTTLIILGACQNLPKKHQVDVSNNFDLDLLYADQSIIGTTPIKPVWSIDGRKLVDRKSVV